MNAYYSHNVLGKKKYLSLRKANREFTFENMQIANFISHKKLSKQINNVDIGELIDISPLSRNSYVVIIVRHQPSFSGWLNFILKLIKNKKTS